jgi:cystathionine beta-lyase
MFLLCNPHNPGGSVWTREELTRLADLCKRYDVLVISDEIHADLVHAPHKHIPFASVSDDASKRTITLMAPSKTFNTAGLTTSIVIAQNEKLLEEFNHGLNTPHLHMGNIFGTIALMAAFNHGEEWLGQLMVYLKENIEFVDNYCKEHIPQLKVIQPEATFLVWIDARELEMTNDELNTLLLNKANVAVNPGAMFGEGGEGFIRVNIGCPRSILEKAFNQIREALVV